MTNTVYFDPAVGGNGLTVTDDGNPTTGLDNDGHRARFVPALSQVVAVASHVVDTAQDVNDDATTASTAAITATAQAGIATTKAGEASASALAASNSADEAEYWAGQAGATATGGVKVSGTDTTAGTLDAKIVAGNNITLTKLNAGGNEQYQVTNSALGDLVTQTTANAFLGSSAFIDIGSIPANVWPVLVSTATTVTIDDSAKTFVVSGTTTVTLPLAADVFGREIPFSVNVKARTGATVTVARSGTDTIETVAGNKTMSANTALTFYPISLTEWETR